MASFNAGGVVEPLKYDFGAVKGFEGCQGIIEEPSSAQVRGYTHAAEAELRRLSAEITKAQAATDEADADGAMPAEVSAVLEVMVFRAISLSPDALARQCKMLSALCSGTPSAAQLAKLPHRILAAFAKWISKEVLDPEDLPGDGSGQVLSLASPLAG
jgi:hypothetical protein